MTELTMWYVGASFVMFAVGFAAGWMHRIFLQVIEHIA